MRFPRIITGSLIGAALIMGSVAPAQARDWDGGWGGGYGHRHHDGFSFGDAVGVAALIGAVAIVAGSVSKDRKAAQQSSDRAYDSTPPVDGSGDNLASEDAATDACAIAARDEAALNGGYAEVRDMKAPQPIDGGWNIDGQVERRASYRDDRGEVRRFTCTIRDGRVAEVYLSRDMVSN